MKIDTTKIIGCVNGHNADDKRCNEHVDFSHTGRAIYEGEAFSCTYCGDAWTDGLTTQERYERKHNVKHCDNCLSYQPVFTGDMCELCTAEEMAKTVPPVVLDSDDTMDITIDDVSWSIRVVTPNGVPSLVFQSEYWDGVRVEIDYTTSTRWFLGVVVNGENVSSLSAAEIDRPMTLNEIMEHGLSIGEQYDPEQNEGYPHDYDYGDDLYDYDPCDPYDMAYDVY